MSRASDEMSTAKSGQRSPSATLEGPPEPCEHYKTCRECPSSALADQLRVLEDRQRARAEQAESELRALRARIAAAHDAMVKGAEDALKLVKGLR